MGYFFTKVNTGAEMDIKNQERWEEAFEMEYPDFFVYHGEIMEAGKLGNIIYGYVGSGLYPDEILYYGGGFANMVNVGKKYVPALPFMPNYGDAPEDIEAIQEGINLRKGCLD